MNCNNPNCKKEIRNYYTCSKCGKSFCTNACVTTHTLEFHSTVQSGINSRSNPQRNSGVRSIFMKMGKYMKEIIDDSFYTFQNFEFVKGKNGKTNENIGSGAFGEVFLAKHKKDGKYYAIKQMDKEKIIEMGATLEVTYREISIHRRLVHENIVRVYSHYEDETNVYLMMDYSNSGTLFNLIKKNKGMDERKAFKFFIQAVAAVNFLHENSLVHRDLKPENLLVDENETVRLCDFGWCVDMSTGNRLTFCGTYEYMAPEILKEVPYDYSIDVWSLGILLYELLHGFSPFRAQSEDNDELTEIYKNIIKYKFKIEKDLSKNCSDLITKLLLPDTKNRLRVKDIFFHPWVIEFEKELKREKLEKIQKEDNLKLEEEIKNKIEKDLSQDEIVLKTKNVNNVSNIDNINNVVIDTKTNNITEKIKFYESKIKTDDKKPVVIKPKESFSLLDDNPSKVLKLKESFSLLESNNKKENNFNNYNTYDSGNKNILSNEKNIDGVVGSFKLKENNDSQNNIPEFSIFNEKNDHNLFDKVLSQVSKKNGGKKKKTISIDKLFDNEILNFTKNKDNIVKDNIVNENLVKENIKISENKKDIITHTISKEEKIIPNNKSIDKPNDKFNLIDDDFKYSTGPYNSNIHKNNISYLDDILDEEVSQKKKKELSKIPLTKDFLEEESEPYYNKNKDRYNEYNLIMEEEFKYPLNNNNNKNKKEKEKSTEINKKSEINQHFKNKKDLDKELDLSFLPKELLYNDSNYQNSNKNLLQAIEILEKAQVMKETNIVREHKDENFWGKVGNFFNPFKCGKDNQ